MNFLPMKAQLNIGRAVMQTDQQGQFHRQEGNLSLRLSDKTTYKTESNFKN